MRGNNKPLNAATILDMEGKAKYYVVPPKLTLFGVAGLVLFLLIAIILGFMVLNNKWDIERMQERSVPPVQESK